MLHGLGGQLGHFTYSLVDRLAADFRVVAMDRPGSGYSTRAPGAAVSLWEQADVVAAAIDRLGLRRPLVVGHSMGGALALALAQRHPGQVGGLALLAPLSHLVHDVPTVFRGLTIGRSWLRRFVATTLVAPLSSVGRDFALRAVFGPDAVPKDYATRGGALLTLRPSHFVSACEDLAALPGVLSELADGYAGMRLPVGILFGQGDRVLDPRAQGQALAAELPGAQLVLIEAGHMLPVAAPERCAQFIRSAAQRARGGAPLP
jgi:pimeloyl-ACP methyl ester carboxylesterase